MNSNTSKTDPKDAYIIAELVPTGNCCRPIQHTPLTKDLRETMRLYREASTRLQQARQQLKAMIWRSFPEAVSNVKCSEGIDGIFDILEDSADPEGITKIPSEQWIELEVKKGRAVKEPGPKEFGGYKGRAYILEHKKGNVTY